MKLTVLLFLQMLIGCTAGGGFYHPLVAAVPSAEMCQIDVLIMVQMSKATKPAQIVQKATPIIQQLDVNPCGAKVAVVSFSKETTEPLLIPFNRYIVKESILDKIKVFSTTSNQWSAFDQCQAIEYASDLLRGRTAPGLVLVIEEAPKPASPLLTDITAKLKAVNPKVNVASFTNVKDAAAKVSATRHCVTQSAGPKLPAGTDPIKQNFHQGVLECVAFIQTLSHIGSSYKDVQASQAVLKTQIGQSINSFNEASKLSKQQTDSTYKQLGDAEKQLGSMNAQLKTTSANLKGAQVELTNAQNVLKAREASVARLNGQIKSLQGDIAHQEHKCHIFKREAGFGPHQRVKRGWGHAIHHIGHEIGKGVHHAAHEVGKGVHHAVHEAGHEVSKVIDEICKQLRQTRKKVHALQDQLKNQQAALNAAVKERNLKATRVTTITNQMKAMQQKQTALQASIKTLTTKHSQLANDLAELNKLLDYVRTTATRVDETQVTLKTISMSIVERLATNIREVLFQFDKDQALYDSLSMCDLRGLDRKLHLVAVSAKDKKALTALDDLFGGFGTTDSKGTKDMSTSVLCVYKYTNGKILKTEKNTPGTNIIGDHGTYLGLQKGTLTPEQAIQKCSATKDCNYIMRSHTGQVHLYYLKAPANQLEWQTNPVQFDSYEVQGTCPQQASFIQYDHGSVKQLKLLGTTSCVAAGLCLQTCKDRANCNIVHMTSDKDGQLVQGSFTESTSALPFPTFEMVGATKCPRK